MRAIYQGNQVLTFFLELAVYACLITWAVSTSLSTMAKSILAVTAVAVFAVAWGLFAAPKASMPVHGAARVAFEIVWFGAGVAALWSSQLRQLSIALAVLLAGNAAVRLAFASS